MSLYYLGNLVKFFSLLTYLKLYESKFSEDLFNKKTLKIVQLY